MRITADGGSTKTTWMTEKNGEKRFFRTQGINPFHQTTGEIKDIICNELPGQAGFPGMAAVDEVFFYGAGCTREKAPVLAGILREVFISAHRVEVDSDMFGAAKALLGNSEGIACILGTGANSCLYDGERIVANIPPMGYILGDEGSGAVIGKTFVNLLYKGGHADTASLFEKETGMTQADIIQRVYREPAPNRFLASLAPFVQRHIGEPWIEDMVIDCFRLFFRRNTALYHRPDLPCSFVGSIAFYFEKQLRTAAKKEGSLIGKLMKEPLS